MILTETTAQVAIRPDFVNNGGMNPQSQDLFQSAMSLPESERADLAASLIRSLDPQFEKDADEAWAAELLRRAAELDANPSLAITRSELWKRVDDAS